MDSKVNKWDLSGRWVDFRQGPVNATLSEVVAFPYSTHAELVKALNDEDARWIMRLTVMYDVANIVSSTPWKLFVMSNLLPIAATITVAAVRDSWWPLICLLTVPIALGLFHPSTKQVTKPLSSLLSIFSYVGFVVGALQEIWWLSLICGIGAFYHATWTLSESASWALANRAICSDEQLFRKLWSSEQVSLKMKDGRTFSHA